MVPGLCFMVGPNMVIAKSEIPRSALGCPSFQGGTGLELLRLKVLAELGYFEIAFESSRCKYVPTASIP